MGLGDGLSLLFRIKADGSQATAEMKKLNASVSRELRDIDRASSALKGNVGGLSGAFSALLNPTALLTGAGIAAGAALISMGKAAFDTAAELFDLSKQTGFEVETLSALKNAADTSGSSIQGMSAALGIFQKNMIAAANGNEKLSATFKTLKIDTADNELALRQAFTALMKMEPGAQQTAAAMQLFGRSGKDVLGVLKEMEGDLDGAIEKFDKMGILINTETAEAADRFGDEMLTLGKQAGAMAMRIGEFVIPTLRALVAVLGAVGQAAAWASEMMGGSFVDNALNAIKNSSPTMALMFATANVNKVMDKALGKGAAAPPTGGGGGGGGGKAGPDPRDAAIKASVEAAKFLQEKRIEDLNWEGVQAERAYKNQENALENHQTVIEIFTEQSIRLANERYNAEIDLINAELIALQTSGKKAADIKQRMLELDFESVKALNKLNEEVGKLQDDLERNQSEAAFAVITREEKMREEADKRVIDRIEREVENETVSRRVGEMAIADVVQEGFRRRKDILEKELEVFAVSAERRAAINNDLILLEGERASAAEQASQRIIAAIAAEAGARMEKAQPSPTDPESGIGGKIEDMIGPPPNIEPHLNVLQTLGDAYSSTMGGIADGMGQMVQNWVLLGNASGVNMKKMVASVLAGVAAQAAVQAVYELALGIAALTPWGAVLYGPAPLHFKSAALFASIAAVAGIAGRAVAGGSFADSGPVAGNAAKSVGGASQLKPNPRDQNRTAGEVVHVFEIRPTEAFIIKTATENIQKNGTLRQVLSNETLATT